MNRLGIDNLMADLTADFSLQLTADYIIYRDEKGTRQPFNNYAPDAL